MKPLITSHYEYETYGKASKKEPKKQTTHKLTKSAIPRLTHFGHCIASSGTSANLHIPWVSLRGFSCGILGICDRCRRPTLDRGGGLVTNSSFEITAGTVLTHSTEHFEVLLSLALKVFNVTDTNHLFEAVQVLTFGGCNV